MRRETVELVFEDVVGRLIEPALAGQIAAIMARFTLEIRSVPAANLGEAEPSLAFQARSAEVGTDG